jgi:beta-barrel assembly-enhancing protease
MVSRRQLFMGLATSLTGCLNVTKGSSEKSLLASSSKLDIKASLPTPQARKWADPLNDILMQRASGFGLIKMPEMQKYLDGLYSRIKIHANVPTWPGNVYILANSALEAYATAAGNVYLSYAWLASMESEDELVALLSHEFSHCYLHYHQLESALDGAKEMTQWAMVGIALSKKISQTGAWSKLDTIAAGSLMGSTILGTAWGRDQEIAADKLGLLISLQLGYSFESGFKAFIERIISWDEAQAKRKEAFATELRQKTKDERDAAIQKNLRPDASVLERKLNDADKTVTGWVFEVGGSLQSTINGSVESLTASHPDSLTRLDQLINAVADLPSTIVSKPASVKGFRHALAEKESAQILANYALATKVMDDPFRPDAISNARRAASGSTVNHALPLNSLFRSLQAARSKSSFDNRVSDPSSVLELNMSSEEHRSWYSFLARASQLLEIGNKPRADNVMQTAFSIFGSVGVIWPQTVGVLMSMSRVEDAKKHANNCSKYFPKYAEHCMEASRTTAEKEAIQRASEQKADSLFNKLIKKK